MKKWIAAGSLIALLIFMAFGIFEKSQPAMEIQVLTEEQLNKLLGHLTEKEGEARLTFSGQVLPYDEESRTFFLPLSMENARFEQGTLGTDIEGSQVVFLEDFTKQDKLALMEANQSIPFCIVEKDGYSYYYLKITGVSIMDFTSSEYVSSDGQLLFLLKVFDNEAAGEQKTSGNSVRAAGDYVTTCYTASRLRGNTSMNYEKKSLRLNLYDVTEKDGSIKKTDKSFLGMRKDNDWILNSLYADGSKIKDKLACDLWEQVGAGENPYKQTFGTHVEYVEVFINGAYQGLYGLMYPIDRKQLGMDAVSAQIESGAEVIERIYKKKYTADWNSQDFTGELFDENMPDYRGGFYLKGDTILQNEEEWESLYNLAACIEGSDEEFKQNITSYVNQENVLQNWLFYQAIGGFDNYAKNYYYIVKNRNGQPQGYFIPWDLNISFGDVYTDNEYYCKADYSVVKELIRWQPGQRMLELDVDNSVSLLKEMWNKWRKDAFSDEKIIEQIEALEQTVKGSGAYEREKKRWPSGRYEEDFSGMKDFTLKRLAYVDEYVEGLLPFAQ